jgi:uncharacterized protein YndB with AHSA1/START domain/DNA-binding transcriptional ArsR family regulator
MDAVFRALADPSRRQLLDRLHERDGQSLASLCADLAMARQSVAKHLAVLEGAGLVTTLRRGREKLHYLNTAPIHDIADRWISRYHRGRVAALADLKRTLEAPAVSDTAFVYATHIRTTPETLWRALTDPAFTVRYWGVEARSDWRVGSPVYLAAPGAPSRDEGMVVLEAEPYRRLSYRWHGFQPEHAAHFGWSAERLAELQRERQSRVTFEIEPAGAGTVKLTLIHDDFDPGSEMRRAVSGEMPGSGGWPALLSGLKTLLETGAPLAA